jgi:hypothetical protein
MALLRKLATVPARLTRGFARTVDGPLPNSKIVHLPVRMPLQRGGELNGLEICYSRCRRLVPPPTRLDGRSIALRYGDESLPVVYIMPSLSHSAHVTRNGSASPETPAGWWEDVSRSAHSALGVTRPDTRVRACRLWARSTTAASTRESSTSYRRRRSVRARA